MPRDRFLAPDRPCNSCRGSASWPRFFTVLVSLIAALVAVLYLTARLTHGAEPGILMSEEKAATLKAMIPNCANDKYNALFAAADLYWTDEEMPRLQQQGGQLRPPTDGGNRDGNIDFPWDKPGGVQNCQGIGTFKLLVLPKQASGTPWPVVYEPRAPLDAARDGDNTFRWMFPVESVIAEVLTLTAPDGKQFTFEVRVRTRERDRYTINLLCNFTTARNLRDGIQILRPEWEREPQLVRAMAQLEERPDLFHHTVTDAGLHGRGGRTSFTSTDLYERLPPLPADLVYELLAEATFEELTDGAWREVPGDRVNRPTAEGFSIVPAKYTGAMLGTDSQSCLRCHDDVGKRSNRFNDSWQGHLRGSDGIFSFNPGQPDGGRTVVNPKLKAAGLVARYDPAQHPADRYVPISLLRHDK